jgi:hypothetical protein
MKQSSLSDNYNIMNDFGVEVSLADHSLFKDDIESGGKESWNNLDWDLLWNFAVKSAR